MAEFHSTNPEIAIFMVSVYGLGFAFGPLVIAPMSEMYGRQWVYGICNLLFVVFTVAAAVSVNMPMLIVFRFPDGHRGQRARVHGQRHDRRHHAGAPEGQVYFAVEPGPVAVKKTSPLPHP